MATARQLLELQELDLSLEAKQKALAAVESQLGEGQAIVEARTALEQKRQRFRELEKAQKLSEWNLKELQAKSAEVGARLYGGNVRSPKELMSLQEEAEGLKQRKGAEEDRLLDLLAETEALQEVLRSEGQRLREMEKEWLARQSQLQREKAVLDEELARITEERKRLAEPLDRESLALYESLRSNRQGRAVTRVEAGRCQGCGLSLPSHILYRLRQGKELVPCPNCTRLLYLS